MSDIFKVIGNARLVKDPELRHTPSGTSVAGFSVAVNRKYNGQEKVSFFNCVAWGKTAEILVQYVKKGHRIGIEGRLEQRSWEDDKGNKRSTVEIVVENFQFLESGKKDGVESIGESVDSVPDSQFSDSDLPF